MHKASSCTRPIGLGSRAAQSRMQSGTGPCICDGPCNGPRYYVIAGGVAEVKLSYQADIQITEKQCCAAHEARSQLHPVKSTRAWIMTGWEGWPQAGASVHGGASMAALLGSSSHLLQSVPSQAFRVPNMLRKQMLSPVRSLAAPDTALAAHADNSNAITDHARVQLLARRPAGMTASAGAVTLRQGLSLCTGALVPARTSQPSTQPGPAAPSSMGLGLWAQQGTPGHGL